MLGSGSQSKFITKKHAWLGTKPIEKILIRNYYQEKL